MTAPILYVLPMLLGRTFDVRNDQVGVDIFPEEVILNPRIVKASKYTTSYSVIRELSDVHNFLKVSGEFSLKVKADMVNIGASGSYIKDYSYRDDMAEILTVLNFQTESHLIPYSTKPIEGWDKFPSQHLGTHYVRTIKYGGELMASIRFKAINKNDTELIKATVDGSVKSGNAINLVGEGKLEKLQKDLHGKASLEISYFATVPLRGVAHTIDGFNKLVLGFRDHVKEVNGGLGVPINVELIELSTLSENIRINKNAALEVTLRNVEELFDDLLTTHRSMVEWLKGIGSAITEQQEGKIEILHNEITGIINIFYDCIGRMDIEKGPEQMKKAINAYKNGKITGRPGKYIRAWRKLQTELNIPELPAQNSLSVYIRWGKTTCNGTKSEIVIEGYAAASIDMDSPFEILCLPRNPEVGNKDQKIKSNIVGMQYGVINLNPFETQETIFEQGVLCAKCLSEKSTVVTLASVTSCPDDWTMEYKGYFLSARNAESETEAVCVDENPDEYMKTGGKFLTVVSLDGKAIPCIVCSN